jgi:hypothetical protein
MGREANHDGLLKNHALAAELAAQAEAVLETGPSPSRDSVSAARRFYYQSLLRLANDTATAARPECGSVRRLARRVDRLLWRARVANALCFVRRARLAIAGAVGLTCVLIVVVAWRAPHDVLRGRPFRLSSEWAKCEPVHQTCGGGRTRIFFHTLQESSPFILYDLGRTIPLTHVAVTNRRDSRLADRAVPLVIETSMDEKSWNVVARRDYWFDEWVAEFPSTKARYLRLRVARPSILHLERVRAWE